VPITPDTKDWTWVLERPCPECGFEAAAFPRDEVGAMVRANAEVWRDLLTGDRGDLHDRPDEATWAPIEYACHVRDVLRLYDERLALMLNQDDPSFPNWDQDATAVEDHYLEQDPVAVAADLESNAQRLATAFDAVSGDQWSRPGRRSDGATFTVESFARYFVHDPIHHLRDVGSG